ncbi:MAG: hypothetical protein ACKVI7_11965 [Rhodobacterales bacterium]
MADVYFFDRHCSFSSDQCSISFLIGTGGTGLVLLVLLQITTFLTPRRRADRMMFIPILASRTSSWLITIQVELSSGRGLLGH